MVTRVTMGRTAIDAVLEEQPGGGASLSLSVDQSPAGTVESVASGECPARRAAVDPSGTGRRLATFASR